MDNFTFNNLVREDVLVIISIQYQALHFFVLSAQGRLRKIKVVKGETVCSDDALIMQQYEQLEKTYEEERLMKVSEKVSQCDCPIVNLMGKQVKKENHVMTSAGLVYDIDNVFDGNGSEYESEIENNEVVFNQPVNIKIYSTIHK